MDYTAPDAYTAAIINQGRVDRLKFTAALTELHAAYLRAMLALEQFKRTEFYPEDEVNDIAALLTTTGLSLPEAALRAATRLGH